MMNHYEDTAGKDPEAYARAVKVIEGSALLEVVSMNCPEKVFFMDKKGINIIPNEKGEMPEIILGCKAWERAKEPDIEKGKFDLMKDNLADKSAAVICWVALGIMIGLMIAGFFLQFTD